MLVLDIGTILLYIQKAHARLRALNQSKTLDDTTKERIRQVLKAEFMSSEESAAENTSVEQASRLVVKVTLNNHLQLLEERRS